MFQNIGHWSYICGQGWSLPFEWSPDRRTILALPTNGGLGWKLLNAKISCFSLIRKTLIYERNKFYNIGPILNVFPVGTNEAISPIK